MSAQHEGRQRGEETTPMHMLVGRRIFAKLTPRQRSTGSVKNVSTATVPSTGTRRGMNLALATWVSAINFWAWNMIGPLSTTYAGDMKLSSTEASMLVATPIL